MASRRVFWRRRIKIEPLIFLCITFFVNFDSLVHSIKPLFETFEFVISTIWRNPCPEKSKGSLRFLVAAAPRNDKFKGLDGAIKNEGCFNIVVDGLPKTAQG
jgi:hypothetical protein